MHLFFFKTISLKIKIKENHLFTTFNIAAKAKIVVASLFSQIFKCLAIGQFKA